MRLNLRRGSRRPWVGEGARRTGKEPRMEAVTTEPAGVTGSPVDAVRVAAGLSPRQRQTLALMTRGLAEKEVARALGISRETVHVYVKALYARYRVESRTELLARFVPSWITV